MAVPSLGALVTGADPLMVPSVYDAIGARAAAEMGFPAISVSGNALSAALLGMPDMGLLGLDEVVGQTRRIADAVEIPVIADGDTGHGGPLNVYRTVRELEAAGASAVHIEDQQEPKRCAFLPSDLHLVSIEEHVTRIRVALEARRSEDFLIIARTDARKPLGFDETLRRAIAYSDAGADWIMLASIESLDEARQIADAIPVPLMVNLNMTGTLKDCTASDLKQAGVRVALYPSVVRNAAVRGIRQALRGLQESGHQRELGAICATQEEYDHLLDTGHWQDLEEKYAGS